MDDIQIRVGERPSMPEGAIAYLQRQLAQARCFLEYGAGGSTVLAAKAGVERIYSVESDGAYAAAVKAKVDTFSSGSVLRSVHVDIGPTKQWGHPVDRQKIDQWPAYSTAVWGMILADGASPDLILIDGRFRVACCLASFLRMTEDAVLMFDDYFDREAAYGCVTTFAPVQERVDRVAIFHKPVAADLGAIEEMYQRYAKAPR